MTERVGNCDLCGDARVFVPVHPDGACPDGHDECPEWACADCGGAVLIGFEVPQPARVARTTGVVAATRAA